MLAIPRFGNRLRHIGETVGEYWHGIPVDCPRESVFEESRSGHRPDVSNRARDGSSGLRTRPTAFASAVKPIRHKMIGMIHEAIREKLREVPFVPFLIRASSGQAYKVSDPSLVVLMKSKVFVAEPRSDRSATIPYLHIAAVEESGNGNSRGRRPRRGQR